VVPEDLGYHNLRDCPYVVATSQAPRLFYFGNDPLEKVATNRSGYFVHEPFDANPPERHVR